MIAQVKKISAGVLLSILVILTKPHVCGLKNIFLMIGVYFGVGAVSGIFAPGNTGMSLSWRD